MAIQLVVQCLTDPAYSHITRVIICGDNFSVIQTLATGTQSLLTIPGKSPAPRTWQTVAEQLDALDEIRKLRINPIAVEFQWIPRRYNINADEICTATMESREPVFRAAPPPPRAYTPPTETMLEAIAARVTSSSPNCIRSIPTFLKPNWQQVLSAVCSWENAPLALLLAPRVLLRKDTGRDLRERLSTLAKNPTLVQQEFWMMAEGCFDEDSVTQKPQQHSHPDTCNWPLVDRMAAQAPARALKILSPRCRCPAQRPISSKSPVRSRRRRRKRHIIFRRPSVFQNRSGYRQRFSSPCAPPKLQDWRHRATTAGLANFY